MKKILVGIGTLGILGGLYTFSDYKINNINEKNDKVISQTKQNNLSMEVSSHADFGKTYDSIQDLVNNSDIVIEGKIIETNYFDDNQSTFTRSKIEVTKTFNDKVKTGDIIYMLERGGITTKGKIHEYYPEKFKITEEEKNTPVQISFDGAPITKNNEHVLIFGVEQKPGFFGFNETTYYPLNSHQGKFNIDKNNTVKRYSEKTNNNTQKNTKQSITQKQTPSESKEINENNSNGSLETSLENMEQQIQNNLQNK